MSANVGWACWHHGKLYEKQFKEPVPQWVKDIQVHQRLRLIRLVTALHWRLPVDVLPEIVAGEGKESK